MPLPQRPPQKEPTGGGAPYKPPVGSSTIKGSPGLITSSGGLFGTNFQLQMPLFDSVFGKTYLALIDPSNFDCEEDAFYLFPQADVTINRKVSVHLIMLTYRELGPAKFTVGVQTYIAESDEFKTSARVVTIAPPKPTPRNKARVLSFPDGKLHTKKVNIDVIDGERPQPFLSRTKNSGPMSVTSLLMVGHADEKDLV